MDQSSDWWAITASEVGLGGEVHTYPEDRLEEGLSQHAQLRRDFADGARGEMRKDEQGFREELKPYHGAIQTRDEQVVEETAGSAAELLAKLKAASAKLDPPLMW